MSSDTIAAVVAVSSDIVANDSGAVSISHQPSLTQPPLAKRQTIRRSSDNNNNHHNAANAANNSNESLHHLAIHQLAGQLTAVSMTGNAANINEPDNSASNNLIVTIKSEVEAENIMPENNHTIGRDDDDVSVSSAATSTITTNSTTYSTYSNSANIYCSVCRVYLSSSLQLSDHESGRKHQHQLIMKLNGGKFNCNYCTKTFTCLADQQKHLQKELSKIQAQAELSKQQNPAQDVVNLRELTVQESSDDQALECPLCKVHFTGLQQRKEHFQGQKHLKMVIQHKKFGQSTAADVAQIKNKLKRQISPNFDNEQLRVKLEGPKEAEIDSEELEENIEENDSKESNNNNNLNVDSTAHGSRKRKFSPINIQSNSTSTSQSPSPSPANNGNSSNQTKARSIHSRSNSSNNSKLHSNSGGKSHLNSVQPVLVSQYTHGNSLFTVYQTPLKSNGNSNNSNNGSSNSTSNNHSKSKSSHSAQSGNNKAVPVPLPYPQYVPVPMPLHFPLQPHFPVEYPQIAPNPMNFAPAPYYYPNVSIPPQPIYFNQFDPNYYNSNLIRPNYPPQNVMLGESNASQPQEVYYSPEHHNAIYSSNIPMNGAYPYSLPANYSHNVALNNSEISDSQSEISIETGQAEEEHNKPNSSLNHNASPAAQPPPPHKQKQYQIRILNDNDLASGSQGNYNSSARAPNSSRVSVGQKKQKKRSHPAEDELNHTVEINPKSKDNINANHSSSNSSSASLDEAHNNAAGLNVASEANPTDDSVNLAADSVRNVKL
jgi:hypothetical protein